jgi:hypothetical protein
MAVVTLGRPDLGRSRVDLFWWYLSQSLKIVLWDTLNILAKAVWDSPASNRPIALLHSDIAYLDRLLSRDETDFTPENPDF